MTPFTPLKLADQYRSSLVVLLLLFTALRPAWAQDEVTLYTDLDSFQGALVQAQVPVGPEYWPVNTATDNTSLFGAVYDTPVRYRVGTQSDSYTDAVPLIRDDFFNQAGQITLEYLGDISLHSVNHS